MSAPDRTTKITRALHRSEFPFTHHRITLSVHRGTSRSMNTRWFPISSLDSIPMPSPHRRALTHLLARQRSAA